MFIFIFLNTCLCIHVQEWCSTLKQRLHASFESTAAQDHLPWISSKQLHSLPEALVDGFKPTVIQVFSKYQTHDPSLKKKNAIKAFNELNKKFDFYSNQYLQEWTSDFAKQLQSSSKSLLSKRALLPHKNNRIVTKNRIYKAMTIVGVVSLTVTFLFTACAVALSGMAILTIFFL